MTKTEKIAGAIYAVPATLIDRLFDGKSKVFVKCTGHASTKLLPKHKIVFYSSHGSKELIGEGTVETAEFMSPEEALTKYRDFIFIDSTMFRDYVGKRQRLLAIKLKGLKRYSKPIQSKEVITMGGKYLSLREYEQLFVG